jgi:transposase
MRAMKLNSTDSRERIVRAVAAGTPVSVAARTVQVGTSTARHYVAQYWALGHVTPRPIGGSLPHLRPEQELALPVQLQRHPGATLAERWSNTPPPLPLRIVY